MEIIGQNLYFNCEMRQVFTEVVMYVLQRGQPAYIFCAGL